MPKSVWLAFCNITAELGDVDSKLDLCLVFAWIDFVIFKDSGQISLN